MSDILSKANSNQDTDDTDFYIITRTGFKELLDTNQITKRIQLLVNRKPKINHVNAYTLMLEVAKGLKNNMTTYEIDEYAANASASLSITNPNYLKIAARIAVDNHQKNTMRSFVDKMRKLYLNTIFVCDDDYKQVAKPHPLVSSVFFKYVEEHQDFIESIIDYNRDFLIDFFGFRTFQKSYSTNINGKPIERPQDLFMRVAIAINMQSKFDLETEYKLIKETYDFLSNKYYSHASPTYYNSGGIFQQLASCFLLGSGDSIEEILKTGDDASKISKRSGGIGVHVNSWRSTGSLIRGTNGKSSGIVPFLKIYEMEMIAFNQGGRRPGAMAVYLSSHHPDLIKFIHMRRNAGIEKERARELFYALWCNDLFLERVYDKQNPNAMWSMFDPAKCGDLSNLYGEEYRKKYLYLESKGLYACQMQARVIWKELFDTISDTGVPYICNSDAVNAANMHSNIGTIKSSNLCVSGDTLILTEHGYEPIIRLVGSKVDSDYMSESKVNGNKDNFHMIWNGELWSKAKFAQTSDTPKPMLKITTSDGCELKCTAEHKFLVERYTTQQGTNTLDNSNRVLLKLQADQLKTGDKLKTCDWPVINKEDVPQLNLKNNLKLLSAVLSRSSIYMSSGEPKTWQMEAMGEFKNLQKIKQICNLCGINPHIQMNGDLLDVLVFTSNDIKKLYNLGMEKLKVIPEEDSVYVAPYITVISIDVSEPEVTYCFNEPVSHTGIFNGIYAMNCTEIMLYSDTKEYAVCVLASISLSECVVDVEVRDYSALSEVKDVANMSNNSNVDLSKSTINELTNVSVVLDHTFPTNPVFDYKKLMSIVKVAIRNLNNVVDRTEHPIIETKRGNERHRPIGLGIQGLADTYAKLRYPFESEEAKKLNKKIFECIYYSALSESTKLCRKEWLRLKRECAEKGFVEVVTFIPGDYEEHITIYTRPEDIPKRVAAYPSAYWNGGSPIANGVFHWELYNLDPTLLSGMFDWESLRTHILEFGVKNSHVTAIMPTATSSQLFGNNECIEPYTSNIYKRETNAGEFIVMNKYLINDLYNAGLWNDTLKEYLLASKGSIQYIDGVPDDLKKLYKTVWEIDQCELIQQAIDRSPFIDQAQSLNLYCEKLNFNLFNKLMHKAWKGKLKTLKYYMHSREATAPNNFTIDPSKQKEMKELLEKIKPGKGFMEPLKDVCEACSA
jgi:ribonucleotide reductase alpha subunit